MSLPEIHRMLSWLRLVRDGLPCGKRRKELLLFFVLRLIGAFIWLEVGFVLWVRLGRYALSAKIPASEQQGMRGLEAYHSGNSATSRRSVEVCTGAAQSHGATFVSLACRSEPQEFSNVVSCVYARLRRVSLMQRGIAAKVRGT